MKTTQCDYPQPSFASSFAQSITIDTPKLSYFVQRIDSLEGIDIIIPWCLILLA